MDEADIDHIRGQYYLRMRRLYQEALLCQQRGDLDACRQLLHRYWALDEQRRDAILWMKDRHGPAAVHRN